MDEKGVYQLVDDVEVAVVHLKGERNQWKHKSRRDREKKKKKDSIVREEIPLKTFSNENGYECDDEQDDDDLKEITAPRYDSLLITLEQHLSQLRKYVSRSRSGNQSPIESNESNNQDISNIPTSLITDVTNDLRELKLERKLLAKKLGYLSPEEREDVVDELRKRKPLRFQSQYYDSSSCPSTPISPSSSTSSTLVLQHPLFIPASSLTNAVKSGYIVKLGGTGAFKNWRKRWFVLHNRFLYYYKTPSDNCPVDRLEIQSCTVKDSDRYPKRPNLFSLSSPLFTRTYYLSVESPEEKKSWMESILTTSKKTSLTPNEEKEQNQEPITLAKEGKLIEIEQTNSQIEKSPSELKSEQLANGWQTLDQTLESLTDNNSDNNDNLTNPHQQEQQHPIPEFSLDTLIESLEGWCK